MKCSGCKKKVKKPGYCSTCKSLYNKGWYLKNRTAQLKRVAANNKRYGEETRKLAHEKKSQPCADCGVPYPYYVMDFDHREDEEKVDNVSTMCKTKRPIRVVTEEMEKCDVVCSNCHRERTHQRMLKSLSSNPDKALVS